MLKNIWYCIKKTSEWYFALLGESIPAPTGNTQPGCATLTWKTPAGALCFISVMMI